MHTIICLENVIKFILHIPIFTYTENYNPPNIFENMSLMNTTRIDYFIKTYHYINITDFKKKLILSAGDYVFFTFHHVDTDKIN